MPRDRTIFVVAGYVVAVVATVGVAFGRMALGQTLGPNAIYLPFVLPVMAAALLGGFGPGVFATFLGAIAATYLFVDYRMLLRPEGSSNLIHLGLFILIGVLLSWLHGALHAAKRKYIAEREQFRREAQRRAQNEQRLQMIADHAPVLLVQCDPSHRYVWANRPYAERFGLKPTDMIGKRVSEVIGNEAFAAIKPYMEQALRGKRVEYEIEIPYSSLGKQWMRCAYQPEHNGDGNVVGYIGAILNVTERKRTEEALRLSRERLDLVLNSTDLGFWYCDLPFDKLIWNEKCKEHFGLLPDAEVTIDLFFQCLHPDDVQSTREAVNQAIAEGTQYDIVYRTVSPGDGRIRWIRAIGKVFFDVAGKPRRFDGITVDVTNQKRAEQAASENETYFRTMADNAPSMLWVTDPSMECTYLSKQWYEYTGRTPQEDLGSGWLENVHPDDLASAKAVIVAANRQRVAFRVDYRIRRRDGEYRWAVDAAQPRFDEQGEFLGYVGCIIDVHERKVFEEALKDADRRKDEFLATLAHELRNPLAPIMHSSKVLQAFPVTDPEVNSACDVIVRQVQQMARLLDDLMDVSRITRGKLELRRQRVDLQGIAQMAVETARPLISAAGHSLEVSLPSEPVYLNADPTRLAQTFANLLNNAAKYTDPGGHIELHVERENGVVAVRVRDSGIGIAAEQLPRIFEMFTQLDSSLQMTRGGLGIGLTLVKRLVEMHGGRITVHSDGPGLGSEFTVHLPVLTEAPHEAVAPPSPEFRDRPEMAGARQGKRRILVADDNRDAAKSLGFLLRVMGNEVRTVHDGVEAVQAASEFNPEVVLLDIGMPRLNGYDTCRQIRLQPGGRDMALIAMTGWGQEDDRLRSQEAGFDLHLVKPVEPDLLGKVLDELNPAAK